MSDRPTPSPAASSSGSVRGSPPGEPGPLRLSRPSPWPTGTASSPGATGTGKTVTLQTLAEGFSRAGVPVFAADVKGDLAGLAMAGDGRKAVAGPRGG